ncbi:hypothetical protein FIM09_01055 [SAR202 cluster bacterium AC-647-P02_OGT_505m]|nr:hypothetical protein [SAR202 cluster bacterium AC-647-P02_OGT_505m]
MSFLDFVMFPFIKFIQAMISFVDSCPPYIHIEGLLEGKEVLEDNDKTVIYISSKRVEVDPYTFGILMIGENLRIRSTRSYRAVSIDRIIPEQGPV